MNYPNTKFTRFIRVVKLVLQWSVGLYCVSVALEDSYLPPAIIGAVIVALIEGTARAILFITYDKNER